MAEDFRRFFVKEHLHFFDDIRFANVDGNNVGPEVEDMIALLTSYTVLGQKAKTMTTFRLTRLSLEHEKFSLLDVKFGSSSRVGEQPDLSKSGKSFWS